MRNGRRRRDEKEEKKKKKMKSRRDMKRKMKGISEGMREERWSEGMCGRRRERRDQTAAAGSEADQEPRSRDSSEVFVIRQLQEPGEDIHTNIILPQLLSARCFPEQSSR